MHIFGFTNTGYNGKVTGIECDIRNGFPGFDIVGLPDTGIRESKERVRTAIRNSGFKFPQQRILVSLNPAGEHKSGALLDLGIALAVLLACDKDASKKAGDLNIMVAGELTLSGRIVTAPQALGAIDAAREKNCNLCIVPFESENAFFASNLAQAYRRCLAEIEKPSTVCSLRDRDPGTSCSAFGDIYGMEEEKEILSIAAAGFHSIFMFGPPGVGKTLLCSRISRLLPLPQGNELEEVTRIYGCAGLERPSESEHICRVLSPDTTCLQFSDNRIPGEGALAHTGVLMMDEVNRTGPKLTDAVKTAYDSGTSGKFPSRFLMAANMNVCPCGGLGMNDGICTCTNHRLENYWKRPGHAFLERFDIRIPLKPLNIVSSGSSGLLPDSFYTDRIQNAVLRQRHRYGNYDIRFNGQLHLNPSALTEVVSGNPGLEVLAENRASSPRSVIGTIALARTIADYEDREKITGEDIARAEELRKYGLGDYYWKTLI